MSSDYIPAEIIAAVARNLEDPVDLANMLNAVYDISSILEDFRKMNNVCINVLTCKSFDLEFKFKMTKAVDADLWEKVLRLFKRIFKAPLRVRAIAHSMDVFGTKCNDLTIKISAQDCEVDMGAVFKAVNSLGNNKTFRRLIDSEFCKFSMYPVLTPVQQNPMPRLLVEVKDGKWAGLFRSHPSFYPAFYCIDQLRELLQTIVL